MPNISSSVWGGDSVPIYQGFGAIDPDTASMYDYAVDYGYPAVTHIGLDIGVEKGTPIYALNEGTVDFAGFNNSFRPNPVYIKTKDDPDTKQNEADYVEVYGHLWTNSVRTGDKVKAGKQIGVSGEQTVSGTTDVPDGTGPHLHFELRQPSGNTPSGYLAVDPTNWLQKKGVIPAPTDGEPPNVTEPTDSSSGAADILGQLAGLGQRSLLVVVGLGMLLIGLWAVMSGGGSLAGRAARAVPALRAASAVKKAVSNANAR